jgi:hypothetical protein
MENWRDIKGYEGIYQISDLGRVKRLPTKVKNRFGFRITKEKILKCSKDYYGYHIASLSKNSKVEKHPVHRLVAVNFLDYKPNGRIDDVIDHINNVREDNRLDNLQIIKHRENCTKDVRGKSKYAGVSVTKGFFKSSLRINSKKVFIGQSKNEEYISKLYKVACENVNLYNGCPKEFRKKIKSLV